VPRRNRDLIAIYWPANGVVTTRHRIFTIACHNRGGFSETPAVRPILIAQISDLHITPPGTLAYGCVDTAAALMRSIETLNRLSARPGPRCDFR